MPDPLLDHENWTFTACEENGLQFPSRTPRGQATLPRTTEWCGQSTLQVGSAKRWELA